MPDYRMTVRFSSRIHCGSTSSPIQLSSIRRAREYLAYLRGENELRIDHWT
jgi:hypothetical protein